MTKRFTALTRRRPDRAAAAALPAAAASSGTSAGSASAGPGARTTSTSRAIGWKSARKCTELLSATMRSRRGSMPTWRNISWSAAWHFTDASTTRTPGAARLASSAMRPKRHPEALEHRPGAGELAVAERFDRELAFERGRAGHARDLAEREPRRAADPDLVGPRGRERIDQQSRAPRLRARCRMQRVEQPGRIAVAAGARIVLRVGEHDRSPGLAAHHRAPHRLVGLVQLEREVGLGVGDRAVEPARGRAHRRLVGAVAEHGHPALGDVRHREAGRERQRRAVLRFQRGERFVESLCRRHERALRRNAGEKVERAMALRERPAGAQRRIEQLRARARRSRPCRRAGRCDRRRGRRNAPPSPA